MKQHFNKIKNNNIAAIRIEQNDKYRMIILYNVKYVRGHVMSITSNSTASIHFESSIRPTFHNTDMCHATGK